MSERIPRVLDAIRDLRAIPTRRSLLPPPARGASDPRWQASWRHLFEVYAPAMERYVLAILRSSQARGADPEDAPDVVQAYLSACLEKGWLERDGESIRCFRAWLKVQLQRFTRTWIRDRAAAKRRAPTGGDPDDSVGSDGPDLDAALDIGLVDAAVRRSLARLREGNEVYAEIIADLLRTDGEGSPDLAARVDRAPKDLAILRHRARRRFASLFTDELRSTVRDPAAFDDLLARLEPHLP